MHPAGDRIPKMPGFGIPVRERMGARVGEDTRFVLPSHPNRLLVRAPRGRPAAY